MQRNKAKNHSQAIFKTTWHPRQLYDFKYIYAVLSRRSKGISIGINLNLDKRCNYDCIYCQVNRRKPTEKQKIQISQIQSELSKLLCAFKSGEIYDHPPFKNLPLNQRIIRDVAFSGDGEPTAFRQFDECVNIVANELQKVNFKDTKIVVITNATYFHKKWMQTALKSLDMCNSEIWAKLDAGTQDYMNQVNVTDFPLEKLLDNIALAGKNRHIIIQTLFAKIHNQVPTQIQINHYINKLKELIARGTQIKTVHLMTVARPPAQPYVTALNQDALNAIATQIKTQTNICVEVY